MMMVSDLVKVGRPH